MGYDSGNLLSVNGGGAGLIAMLVVIAALEVNAIVGKQGPLTTVKGVISCSIVLTVVTELVLMCTA